MLHPTVDRAVVDAIRVLEVFARALAKLGDDDLYLPDGGRPDDDSLMRVRRSDWTLWDAPTDLSRRYTVACKAVHDTCAALLMLDELDCAALPKAPSHRATLVPVAVARGMTDRLTRALRAAQRLDWVVQDEEHILRSLEPLRALQGAYWSELAETPRRCHCGRQAEKGRRTCRRHRKDRAA